MTSKLLAGGGAVVLALSLGAGQALAQQAPPNAGSGVGTGSPAGAPAPAGASPAGGSAPKAQPHKPGNTVTSTLGHTGGLIGSTVGGNLSHGGALIGGTVGGALGVGRHPKRETPSTP